MTYTPTRRGASLRDRLHSLARAGRLLRVRHPLGAIQEAGQAFGLRGPSYLQADGTRTWGSQGRPVSARRQARVNTTMAKIGT